MMNKRIRVSKSQIENAMIAQIVYSNIKQCTHISRISLPRVIFTPKKRFKCVKFDTLMMI